jgi:uncharacterized membrane protein
MKHIELMAECVLGNIRVLERLLDTLPQAQQEAVANIVAQAPVFAPPAPAPVVAAPAPVVAPAPAPAPVVAAPTPAPAPVVAAAPFTTPNEMIAWVTTKWRTLGPVKGAEIQTVVQSLGVESINELTPDKYAELYAKVEAL